MKKLLFLLLLPISLMAQNTSDTTKTQDQNNPIIKGKTTFSFSLGGYSKEETLKSSTSGTLKSESSAFELQVRLGFITAENLELGAGLTVVRAKNALQEKVSYDDDETSIEVDSKGIEVYAKNYFGEEGPVRPYGSIFAGYAMVNQDDSDYNLVSYGGSLGATYFLSQKIGIDFAVKYVLLDADLKINSFDAGDYNMEGKLLLFQVGYVHLF